jgi:threonine synthase
MRAVTFVSSDRQPEKRGLVTQAGAWVFQVREGYAAAADLSRSAARTFGWLDRNTGANPVTIEAKKTVAFEAWEQLDRRIPDVMIAPVGDGPTLVALDKGFGELVHWGLAAWQPRLIGVQAERCQPLVFAWLGAAARPAEFDPSATVADGIAVVRPAIGGCRAGRDAPRRRGNGRGLGRRPVARRCDLGPQSRRRRRASGQPLWPDWRLPSNAAWWTDWNRGFAGHRRGGQGGRCANRPWPGEPR